MEKVTAYDYNTRKKEFFNRHNSTDCKVSTTTLDQYGHYGKTYGFGDGSVWYESCGPVWETVEIVCDGVYCGMDTVKMFRCEFWNSENSNSACTLEKW